MMKGMRRTKRKIKARKRTGEKRPLSQRAKLFIMKRRAAKVVPKKLIARIHELRIPFEEKADLCRGLAEVFASAKKFEKDAKEYILKQAIEMLDKGVFPKHLHNVNSKLVVARLKMMVNLLRPRKKFSFRYKPEHRFPDGHTERDVFVLKASGVGEIGVFALHFNPVLNKNSVWFVQGIKGVDMRNVPRYIGKPWYRAIMDEIIRSAKELYEAGGKIRVRYSTESSVYDKILEEYLREELAREPAAGLFLPLDPTKKRPAKLFRELGLTEVKNRT